MARIDVLVQKLRPGARVPARATAGASGLDLHACLDADMVLGPAPQRVPAGIAIEVPPGYDAQVRPRSGLAARGVMAAFGTIDADYRGEVLVTMWTFGDTASYTLHDGDRIAQLVIAQLAEIEVVAATRLSVTQRGDGGHGSTGR